MIIDSSAAVAVVLDEPLHAKVRSALEQAMRRRVPLRMSAPTLVEVSVVVDRRGSAVLSRLLDDLLTEYQVEIVPFDHEHAATARQAYRDFGKGSGHPARLNLGDCFSYALAAQLREPLLYIGNDFGHTDLRSVLD